MAQQDDCSLAVHAVPCFRQSRARFLGPPRGARGLLRMKPRCSVPAAGASHTLLMSSRVFPTEVNGLSQSQELLTVRMGFPGR